LFLITLKATMQHWRRSDTVKHLEDLSEVLPELLLPEASTFRWFIRSPMKSRSIRCENFASPFRQGASKGRGSTAADNAPALASGLRKEVRENYRTIVTESD